MSLPLAVEPLLTFTGETMEIPVVEEKMPTMENPIETVLFNRSAKPRLCGPGCPIPDGPGREKGSH